MESGWVRLLDIVVVSTKPLHVSKFWDRASGLPFLVCDVNTHTSCRQTYRRQWGYHQGGVSQIYFVDFRTQPDTFLWFERCICQI